MSIKYHIQTFNNLLVKKNCRLVVVSKKQSVEKIHEAYQAGQRIFGENLVQELLMKQPLLPADVEWHMIGHLQRNKVKYIAPFIDMIHSVDSWGLLAEINKQALKVGRVIPCLLQARIAQEETKYGLPMEALTEMATGHEIEKLEGVKVVGLMGMASFTDDMQQVQQEFHGLRNQFNLLKGRTSRNVEMLELSMGMSADYLTAIEEGSTLIRIGSAIFGERITN